MLAAEGRDAADFLNRMTTNDVTTVCKSNYVRTVLLNNKGRIIDMLDVFLSGDSGLLIKVSRGYEAKVAGFLEKYVVIDDVRIREIDREFFHFMIFGEDRNEFLEKISSIKCSLPEVDTLSEKILVFKDELGFGTLNVICTVDASVQISGILEEGRQLGSEEYELKRITEGRADAPGELNEEINPLECGLGKYVSFTKGCYIGQEVIARLDSQKKIPKQMAVLISQSELIPGLKLIDETGDEAGFVSSVAAGSDGWHALGFIRSISLASNSKYSFEREGKKSFIHINKIIK